MRKNLLLITLSLFMTLGITAQETVEPINDATLKSLSVSAGTLSPAFSPEITEYTVIEEVMNVAKVTITPIANHAKAIIEGINSKTGTITKDIVIGSNQLEIKVTAEDKVTTKTYTVNVTRKASSDATLGLLTVFLSDESGLNLAYPLLTPKFNPEITNYKTVGVDKNIMIAVKASASSGTAKVEFIGENFLGAAPGGASFELKAGENIIKIKVTADDGVTTKTYTLTHTKKEAGETISNDAALSKLTVSGGTLTPVFDPSETSYTVNVDNTVESIEIGAEANDPKATVAGTGVKTLNVGANKIEILVTAEDGTTKTYTVNVGKGGTDVALNSLSVSEGTLTPDFNTETLEYSVEVGNEIESIEIGAEANDPKATVAGTGIKSLKVGVNKIVITVTAENGITTKAYTVNVTRKASSDATLTSLGVSEETLSPEFNAETTEYTVEVESEVESIDITATASHPEATVAGAGKKTLKVGENKIEITVTAEDKTTTKTYTVTVTKKASIDATLAALSVSAGTLAPEFNAETTEYAVEVENEVESITITATTSHAGATVTGNEEPVVLEVGENEIEITVTAEDGITTKIYTITVTRKISSDATLATLTVSAGTLTPEFNAETTEYAVEVENEVESITITAEAAHVAATVAGVEEPITLEVGENTVTITVTAEDGTINTYTIIVTRKERTISTDATLATLTVSAGTLTPEFNAETTEYTVEVENEVESITITAEAAHAAATVAGVEEPIALEVGENAVTITVTAEDEATTKTYTIIVTRKTTVSLNSENYNATVVYPNPTKGIVYVNTESNQASDIKIFSLSGKLLKQATSNQISIAEFENGLYLIEANGQTMKIVKE